jgi:hypothetical protein
MKGSSVNLIFFYIMKTTVMHMKYNHILSLKKWLNTTHFVTFEDDKTDCYMQSHNTLSTFYLRCYFLKHICKSIELVSTFQAILNWLVFLLFPAVVFLFLCFFLSVFVTLCILSLLKMIKQTVTCKVILQSERHPF